MLLISFPGSFFLPLFSDFSPYGIAWSFASTTKPAHGDAEEKADKEDGEAPKPTESAKEAEPAKEEEPAKEADAPKSEAAPMEEEKKE